MNTPLLLLAAAVPLLVSLHRAIHRDGVEIDHVVLFSLGFLFYSVFPFALAQLRPLDTDPALNAWYRVFNASMTSRQVTVYLSFSLLMYLSFVAGAKFGRRLQIASPTHAARELRFDPVVLDLIWAPVLLVAALYVWRVRGGLFTGYANYASVYQNVGTLSALSLVLLSLAFLRVAYRRRAAGSGLARLAPAIYATAYGVIATLLLSLGGRLYIASAVLMALVYFSVYVRRIGYLRLGGFFTVGGVLAGAIGTIRIGGQLSPQAVAANLSSESLFTAFSLIRFVGAGRLELINWPRYLMGDLVNLVPSAILPMKTALFLHGPAQDGYVVFAPLGALHMFLSFMVNFGLVGSMAFLFLLGASLSLLRKQRWPAAQVCYAMLSGCMAFTLFRDPFSVSLVKNMFEFSLVVPLIIVGAAHVATVVGTAHHGPPGRDVMLLRGLGNP
ncbi:MAG: hypothetical protein ACR2M1_03705 [Gemmatimonadaceae bacterium]